jgi:hypothetical protein
MRLVSMLHRLYPQKGFVYGKPILAEHAGQQAIRVPLRSRKGSRPICAGCGKRGPGYDQLAEVVSVCAALGVGGVFYGSSRFLVGKFHSFSSMQVRIFRRKYS